MHPDRRQVAERSPHGKDSARKGVRKDAEKVRPGTRADSAADYAKGRGRRGPEAARPETRRVDGVLAGLSGQD
jgi:hypothetical protein